MSLNPKPSMISAAELKLQIPNVAVVAAQLYGIMFKNGTAQCPFSKNHNRGDRDPSLRHDKKKNLLFCASQNCFGQKGTDAISLVQLMDRCSFGDAIQKLADHYGLLSGAGTATHPKPSAATGTEDAPKSPSKKAPVTAEHVRLGLHRRGYDPVAEYPHGTDLRKVRLVHKTRRQKGKDRPEKTFRWEHNVDGVWYSGDGGLPKPLYVNNVFESGIRLDSRSGSRARPKRTWPACSGWRLSPSRTSP
jgi:hypothetical protein